MAENFDLSSIHNFEVELGSSLRHCSYASQKLKQLTTNAVEVKLNNQINLSCEENVIDSSIKQLLDNVQNIHTKLNTIETSVDCSVRPVFNLGQTVQDLENIVTIVSKNKNTIFSHRDLL